MYDNPKINQAIDMLASLKLSIPEMYRLALACCDQAGIPIVIQTHVRKVIEKWWGPL